MSTITFEQMPQALQTMLACINELTKKVEQLQASQPINESPITGEELRKRLQISRPTEIDMRKRGKLPYLMANGQYRYSWPLVMKALSNK
ncbi:MAG: hypothetical protein BGN92_07160 [Sphingobacteriales bacterium 41-5]|nr:MAG: hypothetical protein BGN92_07160 [Sphingobacteriales bacterium 41-5]